MKHLRQCRVTGLTFPPSAVLGPRSLPPSSARGEVGGEGGGKARQRVGFPRAGNRQMDHGLPLAGNLDNPTDGAYSRCDGAISLGI